jgi:hypothetical protein
MLCVCCQAQKMPALVNHVACTHPLQEKLKSMTYHMLRIYAYVSGYSSWSAFGTLWNDEKGMIAAQLPYDASVESLSASSWSVTVRRSRRAWLYWRLQYVPWCIQRIVGRLLVCIMTAGSKGVGTVVRLHGLEFLMLLVVSERLLLVTFLVPIS